MQTAFKQVVFINIVKDVIMKKLILLLSVFGMVSVASASSMVDNGDYVSLQVGNQTVERLRATEKQEFLLSNILYPKRKRSLNVRVLFNRLLRSMYDPDYLQKNPYYKPSIEAVYPYVEQAWKDWRNAANSWLPQKYQLPNLKFSLIDAYASTAPVNTAAVQLSLEVMTEDVYSPTSESGDIRGIGLSYYTKDGAGYGRLIFIMQKAWVDWIASLDKSPEEQQKAAEAYRAAVVEQIVGSTDNSDTLVQQYLNAMPLDKPETWQTEGPWAYYNQQVMTHELGHILGLVHIDNEPNSIMSPTVQGKLSVVLPSNEDGLRLATLVCWYHNQRAKRTVCVPLTQKQDTQERQQAVKKALLDLKKMQLVSDTIPSAKVSPLPTSVPQMDIAGYTPAPAQKPARASAKSAMKFTPPSALPQPVAQQPKRQQAFALPSQPNSYRPTINRAAPTAYADLQNARPNPLKVQGHQPGVYTASLPRTKAQGKAGSASAGQVQTPAAGGTQKAKPICFICGKEIEGNDYYSFTESRHVHKHSDCAYRAFARYHKTDNESLARYEDFYFFRIPQDVVQAKEDMRNLGLNFMDIRRYAAKDAREAAQSQKTLAAANQARSKRAQKDQKCRFYVRVTATDIQRFVAENRDILRSIRQKVNASASLSKKETMINRQYQQLNANYKLTQYCEGTAQ